MIKDKISYLFELCTKVQRGKDGKIEKRLGYYNNYLKNNIGPTVFFDYRGHVALLNIEIYKNGWSEGKDADYEFEFDLSKDIDDYDFKKCRDCLLKLIKMQEGKENEVS